MIRFITLPTNESNFEQIMTLDGEDFIVWCLWNERDHHWYMTLRDSSGEDIVSGIKVVSDAPFSVHCSDSRMPLGVLWIVDTTGSETDPALRDFGTRTKLVYVDEESVA